VFVRLGNGTFRPSYGAIGFGKCDCPFAYSPTLKACGWAEVGGWLADGACGTGWKFCAHIPTANMLRSVKKVKNLAVGLIVVSCIHDLRKELVRIAWAKKHENAGPKRPHSMVRRAERKGSFQILGREVSEKLRIRGSTII
jgi:hypothetical protein